MRTRTRGWAALLVAGLLLAPAAARAQNIGEPAVNLPLPLLREQAKDEGFYFAPEAVYMRINNPLQNQIIAVRGIYDQSGNIHNPGPFNTLTTVDVLDDTVTPPQFLNTFFRNPGPAGAFYGSRRVALETADLGLGDKFEPGARFTLGYRFRNDISVEFVYMKLAEVRHSAGAGITPFDQNVGNDYFDSFLTAPFFNVPPNFSGPRRDVLTDVLPFPIPPFPFSRVLTVPGQVFASTQELDDLRNLRSIPVAAYGIWNGAEDMTIDFVQRFWNAELNARMQVKLFDECRSYMLAGVRYMNLYERFRLRTVDQDIDDLIIQQNTAWYINEIENRFYGAQLGLGNEVYLGGGFALSVETRAALFADVRKTYVKIERGDEAVNIVRNRNDADVSPMFQLGAYLWWFPTEGIQFRVGYEFMGVFNVKRSPHPVSFDLGNLDPEYSDQFLWLDGFNLGVAFIF